MNRFIFMIPLLFVLYGQSFAQWEKTNFPSTLKVNALWEKTNFPSTLKVNTLAVSDSNIYAGTDGDGIFVSTDNGENWDSINEGLQSKIIHTIFINGTTIFAGTETGAYASTDNGLNWNTINSGLSGLGVWSFAVDNTKLDDSTIFAGAWSGVYTSTDNGTNWEATGLYNTTMPVNSIVVYHNVIFAATLGGGVFNSPYKGFTWNDISIINSDQYSGITSLVPVYSLAIIDTNIIAGAGLGVFYYSAYYDTLLDTVKSYPKRKKPILCFAIRSTNLFAGNLIGDIFISNIDGSSWKLISPSLKNQTVYSLTLNSSYIFAGTGSGVWRLLYPEKITNVNNFKDAPAGFVLEQNYPNPFNPVTTIKYSVPKIGVDNHSSVQLKVYNLIGQEVAVLVNEQQSPGKYEVKFDGSNLASGIYLYQLQVGNYVSTKKLMLLK